MKVTGPTLDAESQCEAVLRTLPEWFGIESSLLEYAQATTRLPTFAVWDANQLVGFLTLKNHFRSSWEIHCIAVAREYHGRGLGRLLVESAEKWLEPHIPLFLQVKTIADSSPDPGYALTRDFYRRMGFQPLEEFPLLWSARNPCLQMIKSLPGS